MIRFYSSKWLYIIGMPIMGVILLLITSHVENRIERNFESYIEELKKAEIQFTVDKCYVDSQRHLIRVLKFRNSEEWLFPPLKIIGIDLDSIQPGDQILKTAGSFDFILLKGDGREKNGKLSW